MIGNSKITRRNIALITATISVMLMGVVGVAMQTGYAEPVSGFQMSVNSEGTIRMPSVDYRKDWTMLGSWAIAAEEGNSGSQGMHVVYTQPESVVAYRKTGKFPDGAILIKELFTTSTDGMTTGTVSRADKTTGWFVMIKDSANRYPENKLWGDGWGWAYFDVKDRDKTKSTDYSTDCKGCHVPVQNSDWVYAQGYPVLQQ